VLLVHRPFKGTPSDRLVEIIPDKSRFSAGQIAHAFWDGPRIRYKDLQQGEPTPCCDGTAKPEKKSPSKEKSTSADCVADAAKQMIDAEQALLEADDISPIDETWGTP
jgi:hypothetical protein